MAAKSDRPVFKLTLRAMKDPYGVPAIVRLRHALKSFLRSYNLRCEAIEEIPQEEAAEEQAAVAVQEANQQPTPAA